MIAAIAAVASAPAAADPNGYIRVGDQCYMNIGYPMPALIPIPCPREVLGDN